jgi:glycosyltransferase involved in cell wall biosynthesis
MTDSKRLLLFAYFYPPLGGPAVQRPCKTVKYLTELGWQVDVVTIRDIVYHSADPSLLEECRHHRLFRTASLDPMYLLHLAKKTLKLDTESLYFGTASDKKSRWRKLFLIDHKIGWVPFAVKAGISALLTNRYCAVMVTCGPFSSVLAAERVAKMGKLPLVIDYRDLWSLNNTFDQPQGMSFRLLQRLESRFMNRADLVLTATDFMKRMLLQKFGQNLETKLLPVFNGWDEADFKGLQKRRQTDGIIRIAYLGTLYGDRPLAAFYEAVHQTAQKPTKPRFEIHLVGNFYPETHQEAAASPLAGSIVFIGQQPHRTALQMMLDADILLLVIGKKASNWILTGKLFEYLRTGNPILTLADPGSEAAGILQDCGHVPPCPIDDVDAIKTGLKHILKALRTGTDTYQIPQKYERGRQIRKLHERLLNLPETGRAKKRRQVSV